jgi:hypothetical protein
MTEQRADARDPNQNVKIRLKHRDWEIEIACAETKVKEVIENVLFGIDTSSDSERVVNNDIEQLKNDIEEIKSRIGSASRTVHPSISEGTYRKVLQKTGATCRGLIQTLWREGYFELERSLGQVHEELSRIGYNYDRTAVSHSLTDMVRENILTRIGTMRNYHYLQKRPTLNK